MKRHLLGLIVLGLGTAWVQGAERVLDDEMHHLRNGEAREWGEFPEKAEGKERVVGFEGAVNETEQTLRVRHRDLKQNWKITLNGKEVARLPQDEREMITYWPVQARALRAGRNELKIVPPGGAADDVMIGEIALIDRPKREVLSEGTVEVSVIDAQTKQPIPSRLTITDSRGIAVELGTTPEKHLAIRPGVIYTGNGMAKLRLPAGSYRIYAGRGFEYGIASESIEVKAGEERKLTMTIEREVDTRGWIAADTHLHSTTYARHGDATILERVVTIAGEGIELPVSAEHNMLVDFDAFAREAGVREHFTPVLGSEVTTPALGHFNVFPFPSDAKAINQRLPDWKALRSAFEALGTDPVVILNHGRDVHGGFRPFDPSRHASIAGEDLTGAALPANAMEILNSGAVLSEPLLLPKDWMGLLNRGMKISPIGASDSHDVTRYIVGQGRTYVRCDDSNSGSINVTEATASLRKGDVAVSYGLWAEIDAAGKDTVTIRIKGPGWTTASRVMLFANGVMIRDEAIDAEAGKRSGVKWEARWPLHVTHDVHLVAIAIGPGITEAYWPTAKPYQPTGIHFTPYVMGVSGAVWVDGDGNGRIDSAIEYAREIVKEHRGDPAAVGAALAKYDPAVAVQCASLLREKDPEAFQEAAKRLIAAAPEQSRQAILAYLEAVAR